jgi:hypothetical protein
MVIKVYCWICKRKGKIAKSISHTTVRNVLRDNGVESGGIQRPSLQVKVVEIQNMI